MDRRIVSFSILAVAAPAAVTAWLGARTIAAERAERRREAEQRARAAEDALAARADALVTGLEDALAEADLVPSDGETAALRAFAGASRLVRSAFAVDAAGRFILPRDRPPAPPRKGTPTDPDELAAWRDIATRADTLVAGGGPADAALAAALTGAAAGTFADVELRASLARRQADALARAGDRPAALAILRDLAADATLAAAREPTGEAIAPKAALRRAELLAATGDTEAAVGVLADLVADAAAGTQRLDELERDLVLARAVALLVEIVPARAAAVAAAARADADLVVTVRGEVLPRRRARSGRAERVALPPPAAGGPPRLFCVRGRPDGGAAGVEVSVLALARALDEERAALAALYRIDVALLDDDGEPVTAAAVAAAAAPDQPGAGEAAAPEPEAARAGVPPPGTGRWLAETVPAWRIVATPALDGAAPSLAATWLPIAVIALSLLVTAAASFLAARAASREIELARLRQEFVESVTHELRTPLTSVRSLAEVLIRADGTLPADRVRLYHESIARESVRLAALVENVLKAARLERGATSLAFETVHPSEVVDEALATFARLPEGGERTVSVDDGAAPDAVRLDRAACVQALLNLLSNAAKYSPPGAPIDLAVAARAPSSPGVRFRVRDRGEGISAEVAARLFEPFYRARPDDPTRRGTGLGLRVTRGLARAHGGDVTHERPADGGPGSVFVLDIPAPAEDAPPPTTSSGQRGNA